MTTSISHSIEITCPRCEAVVTAAIWFVIDTVARLDLAKLVQNGEINGFNCSSCNFRGKVKTPLVLHRPNSTPRLVLALSESQPIEGEPELVATILSQLKELMQANWDDNWAHEMPIIERDLLPTLLEQGFGSVQLQHMKRNFVGPKNEQSDLMFEILENLPLEEREAFMAGLANVRDEDAFLEYLTHYPNINQLIESEVTRSIEDSNEQLATLADNAAELFKTYQGSKDTNALLEAISAWENALTHPLFVGALSDLKAHMFNDAGAAWKARFDESHAVEDLRHSIELFENGLNEAPRTSSARSALSTNLGPALLERFQIYGQKKDLDQAIASLENAIELTEDITPENAFLLMNLGVCLSERFDYFGQIDDLIASIKYHKMAEQVMPADHDLFPAVLCNLGTSLIRHFETGSAPHLLNEAIAYFRRAEELTPIESPFLGEVLLNLGLGYSKLFELSNALDDLNAGLERLLRAKLLMSAYPNKLSLVLSNLSACYLDRYERSGSAKDLDASIEAATQARGIALQDNPGFPIILNSLGHGLKLRFDRYGNISDLDRATEALEYALKLSEERAPLWFVVMGNLGSCYLGKYQLKRDPHFLANAIGMEELIVSNSSEDSPDYPDRLSNLASSLLEMHKYIEHLDPHKREEVAQIQSELSLTAPLARAIQLRRRALALLPDHSTNRAGYLNGLATCLIELFRTAENRAPIILEEVITVLEQAISETGEEMPIWSGFCSNLAKMMQERWYLNHETRDLEKARDMFRQACVHGMSHSLGTCLNSGLNWGNWASERGEWQEATEAYQYSIDALDELVRLQAQRSGKELWLEDAKDLAAYAAYAHGRLGNLEAAILILEKGRAQLLSQNLTLVNADLDSLKTVQPDLVESYYLITDKIWALRNEEIEIKLTENKEMELKKSSEDLKKLIARIRMLNGYSNFLQPISLEEIRLAARSPIVYLAVTSAGALGIMVDNDHPLKVIWFESLTSTSLQSQLAGHQDSGLPQGYFYTYDSWQKDQENSAKKDLWKTDLDSVTEWLWRVLMGPLLGNVYQLHIKEIVIIPQGRLNFLPLHASWTLDLNSPNGRRYALDICAINYAPNARVLLKAYRKADELSANNLLAIVDPTNTLEYAPHEVSIIERLFKKDSAYRLGGEKANKKTILDALDQYDVLHFATHAKTDYESPFESGLVLANRQMISLRDILKIRLPLARIAVLSACETGFPSLKIPDELISLPMGMMEAGVPGTIASLWTVDDLSTAILMVCFYNNYLGRRMPPASAFHEAQLWLRDATRQRLGEFYESNILISNDESKAEYYDRMLSKNRTERGLNEKPYEHPFYWAGFFYTGA